MTESDETNGAGLHRVTDDGVWRQTRVVFLTAGLLFFVNILLGFVNALTTGPIPRWQILTHLHAGTLGWITLGVIGVTIWLFSWRREVSASYVRRARFLVLLSILSFTSLITSFGIAFSHGGATQYLVPVFGSLAALGVWAAAIFAITQLRDQPVVTTAHLLVAAGLVVASLGVTVGVWIGLDTAVDGALPVTNDQGIFGHQLTVETYLLLAATGIVEWLALEGSAHKWTRAGLAQTVVGAVVGIAAPVALLLLAVGFPEETIGVIAIVGLVGFLVFSGIFLGRVGWRALRTNPFSAGVDTWVFFGTLWLVVYVASFFVAPAIGSPDWLTVLTLHAIFVGVMTNLLLGVLAARTLGTGDSHSRVELTAIWVLNGGMVIFFALEALLDASHGALVMGVGALLGLATMMQRLLERSDE